MPGVLSFSRRQRLERIAVQVGLVRVNWILSCWGHHSGLTVTTVTRIRAVVFL